MSLQEQILPLAVSLINEFGSTISIKTKTGETYDIATGKTVPTYTNTNVKADISSYEANEISGLIQAGDLKVMISADNITINTTDSIQFDGKTFSIIMVSPLYLQDVKIIYQVTVRA